MKTTNTRRKPLTTSAAIAVAAAMAMQNTPYLHAFTPSVPLSTTRCTTQQQPLNHTPLKPFPLHKRQAGLLKKWNILNMAASDEAMESEISAMKAKDIRQELESYGIPTKSFFEKSELVDALIQARKEGKTPIETNDTATVNGAEEASATSAASGSTTSGSSRQDRMKEEMAKCKSIKVSELKKELESYGVSTKSFFEKSEFERAVAEARVDGVAKNAGGGGGGGAASGGNARASSTQKEEPRDPSFRDVIVSKFKGDKRLLEGTLIDVKSRR